MKLNETVKSENRPLYNRDPKNESGFRAFSRNYRKSQTAANELAYVFTSNDAVQKFDFLGLDSGWGGFPPIWGPFPVQLPKPVCACKCKHVNITGKPENPTSLGWYQYDIDKAFGNLMTVTWSVEGDPQLCTYGQKESGETTFTSHNPDLKPKSGTYNGASDVSGLGISYGYNTATYMDYSGVAFRPGDEGQWDYVYNLFIEFTCTSTGGGTIVGASLHFDETGTVTFAGR
jgi:hypothetical protein